MADRAASAWQRSSSRKRAAEKCRFCEQLGARKAINYRTDDFVQAIARETDSRGVDVVLDMIGGSYVARNVQALAVEGRLVMIATQGGNQGEIDVLRIMQRRLSLMGSTLRARATDYKRRIRDELRAEVWPAFEAGALRPIVDRIFPFAEASQAHAYMESGEHKGKILLAVR
jgi:NADPH:quinone reductase-like Zn-dependent oxidoreductase